MMKRALGFAWILFGLAIAAVIATELVQLRSAGYGQFLDGKLGVSYLLASAGVLLAFAAGVALLMGESGKMKVVAGLASAAFVIYGLAYLLFGGEGHLVQRVIAPLGTLVLSLTTLAALRRSR